MSALWSQLEFVPVLHLHVPSGMGIQALERAWKRQLAPLLRALRAHEDFRCGLHISGSVLHGMAVHKEEGLLALKQLVSSGQVELVAGGWSHPFLSGIPERDALSQLGLQVRLLNMRTGKRPSGVYLSEGVWDPDLPRLLERAGLSYALVAGELLLAAGLRPSQVPGLHHTERGGCVLQVLATDPTLDRLLRRTLGPDALSHLEQRRAMGIRSVLWIGSMSAIDRRPGGFKRWLDHFLSGINDNRHWMCTTLPSTLTKRKEEGKGLVYLPSWVPAHIAEASTAVPENELRSRGGWFVRAGRWEGLMVRYAESNRLHKRVLLASSYLHRLRASHKRGANAELDRLLDSAALALYRAQGSSVLWPAAGGGFYNQALRLSTWRDMLEVEQSARRALGDGNQLRTLKADVLCSGHQDLLIYGPQVHAALEPSKGAVLAEFTVPGVGNLVEVPTRREEPWHRSLLDHTKLPALVSDHGEVVFDDELSRGSKVDLEFDDESVSCSIGDPRGVLEHLSSVFTVDRERRAALSDRFLGPSATLDNLASGQYPEVGDFLGASYTVLSMDRSENKEKLTVSMAREGRVMMGREPRLLQIRKRVSLHRDSPSFEVEYELVNRTAEPVESTFAVDLPLSLTRRSVILINGERRSATGRYRLEHIQNIVLADPVLGLRVTLQFQPACILVSHPVVCVVRSEDGGLKEAHQGVCLLPQWPVKLWGEERRQLEMSLKIKR